MVREFWRQGLPARIPVHVSLCFAGRHQSQARGAGRSLSFAGGEMTGMAEGYTELAGSHRPPPAGARRTGNVNQAEEIEVTVTLRGPDLPGAGGPAAPRVDSAAYAASYGANAEDAAKVQEELAKFGLVVRDVSLAGRSMHVRGTAEQLQAAFGAHLGIYENADQGTFRGREGILAVPAALAGIVTGVFGLDNRRMARRKSTPAAPQQPAITPPELETLYHFPAGDAAGQHVAVAEFGGSYFASDLQAFCQKYGRPVPAVTPVPLGSPLLTLQQIEQLPKTQRDELLGESFEVMMDVEIIAGLCPAADISVYFASFNEQGWIDLLNAAVITNPPPPVALSVSWGLPEDDPSWSAVARNEINQRLQAASMLGVTVCVSAGDDGAGDQIEDGKAHVNFPATSPFVLSVGGTSLTGTPPEEVVWWDAPGDRAHQGGSTGGGVSVVFPRPAWQTVTVASLNPGAIDGRVVPDVAALSADPLYDLIFVGRDIPNGGTSASTPLWAALLARITALLPATQQRRFLTPLLYGTSDNGQTVGQSGCTDITSGDNRSTGLTQGYQAGPGYDAVTGWGSPVGTALQQLLS